MKENGIFICNGFDINRRQRFFRFVRFLQEKGAFTAFKYNIVNNVNPNSYINNRCGHNIKRFFSIAPSYEWINYSMHWAATPQGHDFWEQINTEWHSEINREWRIKKSNKRR
jgi:hypothetical protein